MEKRNKNIDKITIRCSKEKADAVRAASKFTQKNLCELLIEPFLIQESSMKQVILLDKISNYCQQIEKQMIFPEDKKIFREGMKKICTEIMGN